MGESEKLIACRSRKEREDLLADIFQRHRQRLRLMVELRLSPRLQGRIDPSDVLQEAFVELFQRLDEYLESAPMTLFLWLRRITGQKVQVLHRKHLRVKGRDARREVSIDAPLPEATSEILAARLLGSAAPPSKAAVRSETRRQLQEALETMDALDREVIALRHFEELTNKEVAESLKVDVSTASKRYFRALEKLKVILGTMGIRAPED